MADMNFFWSRTKIFFGQTIIRQKSAHEIQEKKNYFWRKVRSL